MTQIPKPIDLSRSLIHCFMSQAQRTPYKEALITPGNALTYQQLDDCSSRIATLIQQSEIGAGRYVGVHTRSPELNILFLLAAFKSQGVYVNLDPDFPPRRLDSIREQLGIELVLTGPGETVRRWRDDGPQHLDVDLQELLSEQCDTNISQLKGQEHYILATSGTTGEPKLVLGKTVGILSYLEELQRTYPINSSDTVLGLSSLAFDGAFREVFAPLICGARLVWDYSDALRNPARAMELMNQFDVTVLPNLVPSRLRTLTALGRTQGCQANSVRLILFCGEPLLYGDCSDARKLFGEHVELVNQYGVSEYSMAATWKCLYEASDVDESRKVPIGSAVGDTRVFIVDNSMQLLSAGETGEICLAGPGLSSGYPVDPTETAKRFVQMADQSGSFINAYLTGDLAHLSNTGEMEFLDRKDGEINIHGLRINPMEVEVLIRLYGDIEACTVITTVLSSGDMGLVAYVVPLPGSQPTTASLKEHLENYLLLGSIPTSFVYLDSLPLTSNGKVDRSKLPTPEFDRARLGIDYVEPETPTEREIASIWQNTLGIQNVGKKDNFFMLGGDSLNLFRMLDQVERQTAIHVPLDKIHDELTVGNLARILDAVRLARQHFSF